MLTPIVPMRNLRHLYHVLSLQSNLGDTVIMENAALRILSIDEKRITTDLDKAGYRKIGAQMIHATTFSEARKKLESFDISVIVINYDFKDVDAVSVCEHFKRTMPEKPVVLTSVQNVPKKILKSDLGPDLFIEQPIPRQYFIEKLRNLLEEKIRDTDRVTHGGAVEFDYQGQTNHCNIQDISKSGVLLETDLNIAPSTTLYLSFFIPGYKKAIRVEGDVVRRINADPNKNTGFGLGVRFKSFQGDSQKRLEKYILKSQSDDPKLVYYL